MKTLGLIILVLIFIIIMVLFVRAFIDPVVVYDDMGDEEITTTTTTTTTTYETSQEPQRTFVGNLKKQLEANGQPFVMDPVDNMKWMLNTTDTWYEDANGCFWNLV